MPPRVMWLPPPVPPWVPSTSNDSVDSRASLASLVEGFELVALLGEARGRRDVDLDDAGVGRDGHRRAAGRPAAGRSPSTTSGQSTLAAAASRRVTRSTKCSSSSVGRQEYVEQAVADLGDHRGDRCTPSASSTSASSGSASAQQAAAARQRVGGMRRPRRPPADRVQRQPQPGGRVALEQHDAAAPQLPVRAGPAGVVVAAVQRQHVGGGLGDRIVEPGQQRGPAVGGVGREVVVGRDRFARRAGARQRPAGSARPRRRAAPGRRAGRARRRWRRARCAPASGATRSSAVRSAHGSASSASSVHSGSPSVRQCSPICQRGNGSPGYHLPWLRCTRPCGAQTRLQPARPAPMRAARLCGPSASVVHSGSTWLSIETNVGSPPIGQPHVAGGQPRVDACAERARSRPTPLRV